MNEQESSLLERSSRIAFAAFLPTLGELFNRTQQPSTLSRRQQKKNQKKHAASASSQSKHPIATVLQQLAAQFPALAKHSNTPFSSWDKADDCNSILWVTTHSNTKHFLPQLFAIAEHITLGFDQKSFYNKPSKQTKPFATNTYTKRQHTLFEQINLETQTNISAPYCYRYDLKPLSPQSIFPIAATECEARNVQPSLQAYRALWQAFLQDLKRIPSSHQYTLSLWLDHFETLWASYSHAVPFAPHNTTQADISLYDHAKTSAALATALWRYHHETETETLSSLDNEWDKQKLLLIQGDFFGIQSFIFANGGASNKKAAKLLRGRSFYVSLLSECAALRILDSLSLPSSSQVLNAAGKFMIIAPNTPQTITALQAVQQQFNQWFLDKTWGKSGIGLAWQAASCDDFSHQKYQTLMSRLRKKLDISRYQRLNLCDSSHSPPTIFEDYLDHFDNNKGVCQIDGHSPAVVKQDDVWVSRLSQDQIDCGRFIVHERLERLLISRETLDRQRGLKLDLFGYYVSFTNDETQSGKFGQLAKQGQLLRAWDFSLPKSGSDVLWNGYARRNINSYVPCFDETSVQEKAQGKYTDCDEEEFALNRVKSFSHLACEDLILDETEHWRGNRGLISLKGDIDNLGSMFQQGLKQLNLISTTALSRQINNFFVIYLPWLCQSEESFQNTYTVFAGGDDFFLIGSWQSQMQLARRLQTDFKRYVAQNSQIHFSVGLSMNKPNVPMRYLATMAETALEKAKYYNPQQQVQLPKNSVSCFQICMTWDDFIELEKAEYALDHFKENYELSTAYIYGLLELVDMKEASKNDPTQSIWHSYFSYRTYRLLERDKNLNNETQRRSQYQYLAQTISAQGIEKYGQQYKVALFNHLYKHRY